MSTALTIIRVLKWLSTLGLLLTVAIGAAVIDRRVTMLLLPPFFMRMPMSRSPAQQPILVGGLTRLRAPAAVRAPQLAALASVGCLQACGCCCRPSSCSCTRGGVETEACRASTAHAAVWPRLAEAGGSLRRALALEAASGEPAGRSLSHPWFHRRADGAVETRSPVIARVPARPNRLVGRGWPELGGSLSRFSCTRPRYWGQSESFTDIPLVKLLRLPFTHLSLSVQRLALAGAGVGCALFLHLVKP